MAGSSQRVRHRYQVQPYLIRSHPGPKLLRKPGWESMKSSLVRERAAHHISQVSSKINHLRTSSPFASYFAGVMQDKGNPDFVVRICTTPLIPPVMRWRDMYYIYISFRQYIAYMHMYLLY